MAVAGTPTGEIADEMGHGISVEVGTGRSSWPTDGDGEESGLGKWHALERFAQPEQVGFSSSHYHTMLSNSRAIQSMNFID